MQARLQNCQFVMTLKQRLTEQDVIGNVAAMRNNVLTFTNRLMVPIHVMETSAAACCAVS